MPAQDKGPMDQFSAHLDRGWDLVARGDLEGAMLSARKGLELDAESPEAHNLIGYIHAAEGNAEEALEHYRHAIDADETFVEAILNAAEVMIHPLHDFDGAIDMIDDALDFAQSKDEAADALLLKIDLLLHAGERDAAANVIAELPEGPYDNRHLCFLVGRAKCEVGDLEGAEPLIRAALRDEPGNAEAQYYMGLILETRGDARGATAAFLEARELDARAPGPPWSIPPEQFERKVRAAIPQLPQSLADRLDGALVVVSDLPGPEVVADGVDPRSMVLADDVQGIDDRALIGRLFVYRKNVERAAQGLLELDERIFEALRAELEALFPETAQPPEAEAGEPGMADDASDPDAGAGERG